MPTIIPALPTQPGITPLAAPFGVPTTGQDPYTVAAGTTLYGVSIPTLIERSGSGWITPFTNNGTMWLDVGITTWTLIARHVDSVTNNGTMVLRILPGTTADATGFDLTDVDNYGQIFIVNQGIGDAIAVDGYNGGHPINAGLIAVQALGGTAFGYLFNNPGSLDNRAGGQILVEGMGAIAYYQASSDHPSYPSMITNAGTIRAVSLDPQQASLGFFLGGQSTGTRYIVTNSGQIAADIAIYGDDSYATVVGQVIHQVYNLAGGRIDGLIYLQRGDDLVDNDGTITGDIDMGEGADVVDTQAGTIGGVTSLGWGNDIYRGGNGTDLAAGGRDNDTLDGGGGNDQLMGGGGDDLLTGGAGNDGLFGEWGNDRIVTSGGDFVDGGDGNDRIELGDYSFETIRGGNGFDTLVLPGPGTRTINLAAALAESAFDDIEKIELTGGKTLIIQASDVTALTGGETSLFLATTLTDQVKLVGTWTRAADQLIAGVSYKAYTAGAVTILVSGTGAIITNAVNEAGALDPSAGGDLAPIPGTSLLDFTNPVTILDNYELTTSTTIAAHEIIRAGTSGVVFTDWSGTSLTNYGTVESISPWATTLRTNNIYDIINYGTIRAEASGPGFSVSAIGTNNSANIENYGLVTVLGISGASGIGTYDLLNLGTIDIRTQSGSALGVSTWNGALFDNRNVISVWSGGPLVGSSGSSAVGVDCYNQSVFRNSGTITATVERGIAKALNISVEIIPTIVTNTGTLAAISRTGDDGIGVPEEIGVHAYTRHTSSLFQLVNSGTIHGLLLFDGQGSFNVQNSGLIEGGILLGFAVDYVTATLSVTNSGTITGNLDLRLGESNISVQNNGQMNGTITLGKAGDAFDGRLGTQSGAILGGDGNDTIWGGVGAETIAGNAGTDRLTGGGGADSFRDTSAGLNGDTITDFSAADRIILTDATLAGFAFTLTGSTLTYTGGSLTLTGFTGSLTASAAAGGGVQISVGAAPTTNDVRNDFNGDGRSDILWRNVDGQMSNWLGQANGGFVQNNANAAAVVPTAWQIAGTGDFNGDGRDDILWRNTDGQISNWLATAAGGYTQNNANAAAVVPIAWHVVGIGDFNGDGRDDILWRHNDGTVSNWLATVAGGFTANDANAARFAPTNWHVAGTGDFNGDGRDDVLWRNDNGQLSNWLGTASGGFTLNDSVALTMVDPAWRIAGTGDFNGDGRDDILWRHTDGTLSNWLGTATGGFVNNGSVSGTNVPLAWSVVAIGDYNGDGRDDILWRHTDGTLSNWLGTATGGFTPNDTNAATPVPTAWHVQPEPFWL